MTDDPWVVGTPVAEVQRVGRWTYRVSIARGLVSYGDWYVLGRRHAERKAARILARYLRDEARRADVTRIESEDAA